MPLFETVCGNIRCSEYRFVHENYYRHWDDPNPKCDACGIQRKRLVSAATPIWMKPISEYGDPKKESYQQDLKAGGHWVWRKRSSRRADGAPEREFITSHSQQMRYCKDEGLIPPSDMSSGLTINKEGTKLSGAGMPGCWT